MMKNSLAYQRRVQQLKRYRICVFTLLGLIAVLAVTCIILLIQGGRIKQNSGLAAGNQVAGGSANGSAGDVIPESTLNARDEQAKQILAEADLLFAGYDPDAAIAKIKEFDNWEYNTDLVRAMASYRTAKDSYTAVDVDTVTHIFFHTLISDTQLAFATAGANGYNAYMCTITEYQRILQQMYEKGYVLVDIHDLGHIEVQKDGTEKMVKGEILLPPGKIPFVLSQDDVNYYQYMLPEKEGDPQTGFASKLMIDENNNVLNEITQADGTVVQGAYDIMPITEQFIAEHPDFSYRGARGMLAVTGYNGVMGYRTSYSIYHISEGVGSEKWGYNANIEADRATATAVANRLKELGWTFASHSFNHLHSYSLTDEQFAADNATWAADVESIVGKTDVIVYPFGEDPTGTWRSYTADNVKINDLKAHGFRYFCNVDSRHDWLQWGADTLRQGRRNIDGLRLWEAIEAQAGAAGAVDRLSDLFDPQTVFDQSRPTPISDKNAAAM